MRLKGKREKQRRSYIKLIEKRKEKKIINNFVPDHSLAQPEISRIFSNSPIVSSNRCWHAQRCHCLHRILLGRNNWLNQYNNNNNNKFHLHLFLQLNCSQLASPACTELEVIMLDWLGKMLDLPKEFLASGGGKGGAVIQVISSAPIDAPERSVTHNKRHLIDQFRVHTGNCERGHFSRASRCKGKKNKAGQGTTSRLDG